MAKNKPLNLSVLKKLDSELNNKVEVTLSNSYTLQIDKSFRNSKIEEVFDKLMEIYKITQNNESLNNFPFEKYSLLLLIFNFTSFQDVKINTVEKELQVLKMLEDQDISNGKDLFNEIIGKIEKEVPDELMKFNQRMFKIMEERINLLKQQQKFYEVLGEEIDKQRKLNNNVVESNSDKEGEDVGIIGTAITSDTNKDSKAN